MKLHLPWRAARAEAPARRRMGMAPGSPGKPSRILAAKRMRARGRIIPWRSAVIYVALVAAAGFGLAAWDRAYEARFRPPPLRVLAKNLVESLVGAGTVRSLSVDEKARTIEITVEDVLVKPGQSPTEQRQNLTQEGTLAIQVLRTQLKSFKTITVHLVKAGKSLATVAVTGERATPTTEFAPDLR